MNKTVLCTINMFAPSTIYCANTDYIYRNVEFEDLGKTIVNAMIACNTKNIHLFGEVNYIQGVIGDIYQNAPYSKNDIIIEVN